MATTYNQYHTNNEQQFQAQAGLGPNGQKIMMVQHVEKKTIRRMPSGITTLEDLQEKKREADELAQQFKAALEGEIMSLQSQLKSITGSKGQLENGPVKLIGSGPVASPNAVSTFVDQNSFIQHITTPQQFEAIVNDLQRQLQFRGAEIRILRKIVEGASSLADADDEMDVELSEGMAYDVEMLRAWNMQLRHRIRQLEESSGCPKSPTKSELAQSRSRSQSPMKRSHTIGTQSMDVTSLQSATTPKSPLDLSATEKRLKENDLTIQSLSDENAKMRLELADLKAKSEKPSSPTKAIAEAAIEQMKIKYDALLAEKDKEALNHSKAIADLSSQFEQVSKKMITVQTRNAEMENEIDRLVEERSTLEKAVKLRGTDELLKTKFELMSRHLESATKDNMAMLEENKKLKKRIEAMGGGGSSLKASFEDSKWEVEKQALEKQLESVKQSLVAKEDAWAKERVSLAKEVATLKSKPTSLEADIKRLTESLRLSEEHCKTLEEGLEKSASERMKLLKELEATQLENNGLVGKMDVLEGKLKSLELAMQDKNTNTKVEDSAGLRAEREALRLELDMSQSKILLLQKSVEMLESELKDVKAAEREAKHRLDVSARQASESLESIAQLDDANKKLQEVQIELETVKAELHSTKLALAASAKAEVKTFTSATQDSDDKDPLKAELSELKTSLKFKSEQLESVEQELQKLRLAQADVGSVLLLKGRDAASSDMIHSLQRRCEELAGEILAQKSQMESLNASLEVQKKRALEGTQAIERVEELKAEISSLKDQIRREKEVWSLKERNFHKETERAHSEYHQLSTEMETIKKVIWDHRQDGVWRNDVQLIRPGSRMEDLRVLQWVKWMVSFTARQQKELEETHMVLDLQHEKLETAMVRASMSVDGSQRPFVNTGNFIAASDAGDYSPHRLQGPMVEQGTQTDTMLSFARMGTIKASVASRSPSLRAVGGSGLRSRTSSMASSVASVNDLSQLDEPLMQQQKRAVDDNPTAPQQVSHQTAPLHNAVSEEYQPQNATTHPTANEEKLQAALSALTGRYVTLQQTASTLQTQLEHQLKANAEIKKLIVGASLGGMMGKGRNGGKSDVQENLLERYNDALVEIGALRTEVDRWRIRCEEVEEVVENIVLKASEHDDAGASSSEGAGQDREREGPADGADTDATSLQK
ncbi:hypothetical protein HDV05_001948 [Chytridiales sp. JEL 0842]|nr:hypothetical protein HDV05_001948 [Chytridiales sp. JEL 0842]